MSQFYIPRVKGVTGPSLFTQPFLGNHHLISGKSIYKFFMKLGLPTTHVAHRHIHYFCQKNGFLLNINSPFGKAVRRLSPYTRANIFVVMIPHLVNYHKVTNRRIRQFLLRPTPTHLHFIPRFHSHPLPTNPPTPSLHNLIRNRLNPPTTTSKPIILETPIPRKTQFTPLRITTSHLTLFWKPQDTLYGSRFRCCFPREGVG